MFKLFKKTKAIEIFAPCDGELIPTSSVTEDELFQNDMIGKGVAIIPSDGGFVVPMDGKVVTAFATGHAYGIKAKNGLEILVHIGVNTVQLKGDGFDRKVEQDTIVTVGQPMVEVNLQKVKSSNKSLKTPILVTNDSLSLVKGEIKIIASYGKVKKGDLLYTVSC